jgi:CDGSH-type Zn-finger protein
LIFGCPVASLNIMVNNYYKSSDPEEINLSSSRNRNAAIECSRNGPYLIRNVANFQNSKGEEISTKKVVALCRFRQSDNRPFCDGTHAKIGFPGKSLQKLV